MMLNEVIWRRCAAFAAALALTFLMASAAMAATPAATPSPTTGETRRAFVLGVKNYPDPDIQSLELPEADAKGIASDLEEVGFDKKNITTVLNLRAKADFDRQFSAFVASIHEGDVVLFYYSGHGVGLEANNTDYLLLGGIRSLFTFAHDKLPAVDRANDDIVRLKMPTMAADYESDEIAKNGVAVPDVIAQIGAKKPRIMILMLDACRSLATKTAEAEEIVRGPDSGSRMLPMQSLPQGAMVIFSASFGEAAIEKFAGENRKNSLFTEVVRSELQRPGQTLVELADRISLVVRDFARNGGKQQEPDYYHNLGSDERFQLVPSVGAERFVLSQGQCEGAKEDWEDIRHHPQRDTLERHQTRYHDCPTAEFARRALVNLLASSQDPMPIAPQHNSKPIDDCDRLAASDADPSRPPEVPGVALAGIVDYAQAIQACDDAIKRSPRVARFLHNLARAQLAAATFNDELSDAQRSAMLKESRATFSDAAQRGYVEAIYDLAVLFPDPDAAEEDLEKENKRLKEAADQQYGPAMYELANRYNDGSRGVELDYVSGYQWMIKAAERGYVPAMVRVSDALFYGRGVSQANPRRAVEWAVRAANAGSTEAKYLLGYYFYRGRHVYNPQTNEVTAASIERDYTQALLWWGRAAEDGSAEAQNQMGVMMERGTGLPAPQPEVAERYFRLAAHGGDEDAEYELARRLREGKLLAKPENGDEEALDLLRRALSHGSARAAQMLAEIYRNGELGVPKDPVRAVQYAFQAIKLATLADPTTDDGDPYHEMAAGIQLVEMAYNDTAVDSAGRLLFKPDELARMRKFYGEIDVPSRRVKVRSFEVPLNCNNPRTSKIVWYYPKTLWVWDWGRVESPTEPQFRSLERQTSGCTFNDILRQTLIIAYDTAKKNKVPYADLVEQEVLAAQARENTQVQKKK
jgi:TPR repeat protein